MYLFNYKSFSIEYWFLLFFDVKIFCQLTKLQKSINLQESFIEISSMFMMLKSYKASIGSWVRKMNDISFLYFKNRSKRLLKPMVKFKLMQIRYGIWSRSTSSLLKVQSWFKNPTKEFLFCYFNLDFKFL